MQAIYTLCLVVPNNPYLKGRMVMKIQIYLNISKFSPIPNILLLQSDCNTICSELFFNKNNFLLIVDII